MNEIRSRIWHFWFTACLALCALSMVAHQGCSCDGGNNGQGDAAPTERKPPETRKGRSPMTIRFITPKKDDIISGQIVIEAEVIDADGVKNVGFWANDKLIGNTFTVVQGSPPEKPRYRVQVASYFLPRGILSLTARGEDNFGQLSEVTIQVSTRERWAAAFGAGRIQQLQVRDDGHIYSRIYRTEEDLSRVQQPGPNDKVGSAILTVNAVGAASWAYLGVKQSFTPFVFDKAKNIYFGAKDDEKGTTSLRALGPGRIEWTPNIPVQSLWETPLGPWTVTGRPINTGNQLWVHLSQPAQAGKPGRSAIALYNTSQGKQQWIYEGPSQQPFEILRGPYLLNQSRVMFVTRKPGTSNEGFQLRVLDATGKIVWVKPYDKVELNVVLPDPAKQLFYIGVQARNKGEVISAAVYAVSGVTGDRKWSYEMGTSWPNRFVLQENQLLVLRRPPNGSYEVVGLNRATGKFGWKVGYDNHQVTGVQTALNDDFFVIAIAKDQYGDAKEMQVHRYDAKGKRKWEHKSGGFAPKTSTKYTWGSNWFYSKKSGETLWLLLRNMDDRTERLGSRLMGLDKDGKRLFLFNEEARIFDVVRYIDPNRLYVTSYDPNRDGRVHMLVPR